MNDFTPLHDDSLDEGLRTALLQIDRGPALSVDVDEVLRRGARHRRVVAFERVGAVAAVALVVVGSASFLNRATPGTTPVAPSSSTTTTAPATAFPTPSQAIVVAPKMVVGSSGTSGEPKTKRGLVAFEIVNTGTEATSVSIASATASGASVKAVLQPTTQSLTHTLVFDDSLFSAVDRPSPASVTVPAGQYVLLVVALDVTRCEPTRAAMAAAADNIQADIALSLRTSSGGTGTLQVERSDGPKPTGWLTLAAEYACGFPPKS